MPTHVYKITAFLDAGPYLFFGGLFAFLLNKEIYVLEEQAHMLCGWILFYLLLSRTIGCAFHSTFYIVCKVIRR
uniref:Uncharacterized protein n=1 Tax=Parascaris equorum TaxID=6256 RepID=A0A914S4Z8_PAREQ